MTESGSDEGKPLNDNTKREFELAYVLDYIKTGVEAIIEDQVTSRFEAQELKVAYRSSPVIISVK